MDTHIARMGSRVKARVRRKTASQANGATASRRRSRMRRVHNRIRLFDDWLSLLHFLYAALIALLDPTLAVAASIAFTAYQLVERERGPEKLGDFVEWMLGLLAGALARALLLK